MADDRRPASAASGALGLTAAAANGAAVAGSAARREPSPGQELRACILASLQRLTMEEFQMLLSPAQQRALVARYEGLSDASKLSALRRVREALDMGVDDCSQQRAESLFGTRSYGNAAPREAVDVRVQDYTLTLHEVAAEARTVEQRYNSRQRGVERKASKPYLSEIFTRELEKARAAAGASPAGGNG
eukprot:TRINITY_DN21949_c0_g1_i1.p1 TRINITY_DN21949_c0_g1~~TRINITY_DN21949_c0_g1_i1.p1  ORF type:complete len:189 (-),score=60.93 TRINITY_DN21949_c0_g1_i1:207-773(-)